VYGLAAGGSSGTVGVLRVNNPAAGSSNSLSAAAAEAAADADDSASAWLDDPHVSQLVGYGYPADHAMAALQACGGSLLRALHSLQQQLLAGSSSTEQSEQADVAYAAAAEAGAGVPEAWCDEVEVLSAIYGDELDSSSPGLMSLAVEGGEQVRGRQQVAAQQAAYLPVKWPASRKGHSSFHKVMSCLAGGTCATVGGNSAACPFRQHACLQDQHTCCCGRCALRG
jgi:hypothetical protein